MRLLIQRLAAAVMLGLAMHGIGAPAGPPLVCAPVSTGRVLIDGDLTDAAWRKAQAVGPFGDLRTGTTVIEQPTVLVIRDATMLYIGARLPKPKDVSPKASAATHDGPVWADDALEVFLDPGRTHSRYYQFIANAGTGRWDSLGKDGTWNATWKAVATADSTADFWSVEIGIPFASLGGAPKPGTVWGFNIAWDRQVPSARVASWAPLKGTLHKPKQFGMLWFGGAAIMKDAVTRLSPARGELLLSYVVTAGKTPVTVRSRFGPENQLANRKAVTVRAGATQKVSFRNALPLDGEGLPTRAGMFVAEVTATANSATVFRAIAAMKVPARLTVTVRKYLLRTRRIEIEVNGGLLTVRHHLKRLEASLVGPSGKVAVTGNAAFTSPAHAMVNLDIRAVSAGSYDLRIQAVAADGKKVYDETVEKVTIPPTPKWLGNREGFSDRVLAPWTPIGVEGSAVRPALREYRWGALPFPASVTARGKRLLTGPMRLLAVIDGKRQVWRGKGPVFSKKTPARVEFSTFAEGADATVRGSLWCEYDGCVKCDWELTGKKADARLDSLVFEIPFEAAHARYLYHYPGRWRSAFNSGALPADGAVLGFRPFIWLGDEWRGLSWFCPSDAAFRPANPNRMTQIVRGKNSTVLRIQLVGKPIELNKPFRTTFGFEATPVRSNPRDVWDYRIIHTGNYGLEKRPWSPPLSITWPAEKNIDLREGTLEAWVRPQFDPNVPVKPGDPGRGRFNRDFFKFTFGGYVVGYYWNIDDRGMRLYVKAPGGGYPIILGARCPWEKGEWHHIAFSWGKEIRLYNDGKLVARRTYKGLLPTAPRDLLGGRLRVGGNPCEMDVDSLVISDVQRPPRGVNSAPKADAHTLLFEPFDALDRTPAGVRTVPEKAGGSPGTVDRGASLVAGHYGRAVSLAYQGPPRTTLDRYRELGVRTICFHEHWSRIQNYLAPADPDGLRRLVRACHKRGIRLLVYYGYELSNIAPEWATHRDEVLVQPRTGGYHRQPEQRCYICCYHSAWQDYIAWAIARTIDEYGVDGVYLDGTANPHGCANLAHGCGWVDAHGRRHKTYPFFAVRQMMKRIYTIVKTRNPNGLVNVHQSTCMTIPSVGWATSYWDGEQFGSIATGPKHRPLDVLPLDTFRTEFMGHNWGVPAELLCYGRPYTYAQALAIALPHDVLVRPNDVELLSKIWKAAERFGRKQSQWLPYWENSAWVTTTPKAVKCSLYTRDTKGVLAVVSNLESASAETRVRLNCRNLKLPAKLQAWDALSGNPLQCADGVLSLHLAPLEFRMVRVEPAAAEATR